MTYKHPPSTCIKQRHLGKLFTLGSDEFLPISKSRSGATTLVFQDLGGGPSDAFHAIVLKYAWQSNGSIIGHM